MAEKILHSHLWEGDASGTYQRGRDGFCTRPCRHAGRDGADGAAAVHASGRKRPLYPRRCTAIADSAKVQADSDLQEAINKNNEVYNFLESVSNKYGIGFEARRIIHQVVLENYAFPGGMMIGTDSHTVKCRDWAWWPWVSAVPTLWT